MSADLLRIYLPSSLTHADYPALISEQQPADTVAVGAVMAVYNWERNTDRYRRTSAFVEAFFDNFEELSPPRHSKRQGGQPGGRGAGMDSRFGPAQDWLERRTTTSGAGYDLALKSSFEDFLKFMQETGGGSGLGQNRDALFTRFLEWRAHQPAQQPPPVSAPALPSPAR
ncbi:MAG: hypothetical protein IPK78_07805 [Rhodospirillales bacterium]|nr:hypothetical protein [Rhodospirillales bacterium]